MRTPAVMFLISGWLAGSLAATPQAKTLKANLAQQIQTQYMVTKLSGGRQVKQLGSVLVVQRDGIGALPAPAGIGFTSTFGSNYKDGKIRHDRLSNFIAPKDAPLRDLQVGENVYLLKVDVKDSSIVFEVQTCGACDPSTPDPSPYRAAVTFPFAKGYLDDTPMERISRIVEEVFGFANIGMPGPPGNQPPPPVSQGAPQAVPPPPPDTTATPARIELGQTPEQVVAALGQPDKSVDLGSKRMYVYKDFKIIFVDGKVADVQ